MLGSIGDIIPNGLLTLVITYIYIYKDIRGGANYSLSIICNSCTLCSTFLRWSFCFFLAFSNNVELRPPVIKLVQSESHKKYGEYNMRESLRQPCSCPC